MEYKQVEQVLKTGDLVMTRGLRGRVGVVIEVQEVQEAPFLPSERLLLVAGLGPLGLLSERMARCWIRRLMKPLTPIQRSLMVRLSERPGMTAGELYFKSGLTSQEKMTCKQAREAWNLHGNSLQMAIQVVA